VSTKKTVTMYTLQYKSGKQRRILTKFYTNTESLNDKQVSHQISAKSVNICNSYSKFDKVAQKHKCHRHWRD